MKKTLTCGTTLVLIAAALLGASPAEASTTARAPRMSVCLGAPFPLRGDATTGRHARSTSISIFGPRGTLVWQQTSARSDRSTRRFRAERTGAFRSVYREGDEVAAFDTIAVKCGEGPSVTLSNSRTPVLSLVNAEPRGSDTDCVVVTYSGAEPGVIRLYGATAGDGLARHLELTITRGIIPTTSDGWCRGFNPDDSDYIGAGRGVVYRGSLERFPDRYGAGYLDPTPRRPERWTAGESHAYRLSVSLRDHNAAQGRRSTQTFSWGADAGFSAGGKTESPRDTEATGVPDLAEILRDALRVIVAAGKRAVFPAILLVIVAAFLVVQDRIDRRDPKLALAPVYPDPDLVFLPREARGAN